MPVIAPMEKDGQRAKARGDRLQAGGISLGLTALSHSGFSEYFRLTKGHVTACCCACWKPVVSVARTHFDPASKKTFTVAWEGVVPREEESRLRIPSSDRRAQEA